MLPFKPTLFAAFLGPSPAWLQPVSVAWTAPKGEPAAFYGWWGDMALAPHLASVLAARAPGGVTVTFHPPVPPEGDRKALASRLEGTVRAGLEADLSPSRPPVS
ncbi:hypothetical protein [Wenxinia marina]|uniref:Uncharacterized protein n=1 Tax=Wenxinia marina DSM 24838 TaxID=1123501 RepID=A0A0D0PZH1_9RHOB|nr:hypothetical protein Wenmar_03698 [Wenxinia marina DSM 24838]